MSAPSFITPGHVRAFQAVRSQLYDNIALWSLRGNAPLIYRAHAGLSRLLPPTLAGQLSPPPGTRTARRFGTVQSPPKGSDGHAAKGPPSFKLSSIICR